MARGRKKNQDKYIAYLIEYTEKLGKLKKKYGSNFKPKEKVYSRRDYEHTYAGTYNTRKEQVKSGERKSTGNIRRDLINRQLNISGTDKQTKKRYEAIQNYRDTLFNKTGPLTKEEYDIYNLFNNATLSDMRYNGKVNDTLDELLSDYYENLTNAGLSSTKAAKIIGQEFFGSE